MTIDLSSQLESELHILAGQSGKNVEALVQEAIRQYLDAAAITDLQAEDVGTAQEALLGEMGRCEEWPT